MKPTNHTIALGIGAAERLKNGQHCIFIGDGAAQEIRYASNLLVIETPSMLITKRITSGEWNNFNNMLQGATLTFKEPSHDQ